ncbi:MAG: hypothetical protein PHQ66_01540 [Candidatus Nanoarchaeia archaeon]|nr:hypothetical protein [Candidatus Nanoarchaeia archaeon]MDD5357941.1 hypothetical protein [Candidatus Nanoarchaeia archaeon]MDD5588860.1 hypothetical protein [Candidatus Nanoarchaeia archaeon]
MTNFESKVLVMCAWCKRIKLDGKWVGEKYPNYEFVVESYGRNVTHTICKDDAKKYYPNLFTRHNNFIVD